MGYRGQNVPNESINQYQNATISAMAPNATSKRKQSNNMTGSPHERVQVGRVLLIFDAHKLALLFFLYREAFDVRRQAFKQRNIYDTQCAIDGKQNSLGWAAQPKQRLRLSVSTKNPKEPLRRFLSLERHRAKNLHNS